MVVCLERGADLHMAQLMPLPLSVSCFSKIQIGFTFLVPAHLGSPGQRAVMWMCVCVCVSSLLLVCWQAMIGLTMDGKIQRPKYDFDCEEFRYNHRFSQFICLTTPPPLPYLQYKVSVCCQNYGSWHPGQKQ